MDTIERSTSACHMEIPDSLDKHGGWPLLEFS